MEERRDEHSHGKEELITKEKWRDRQTTRRDQIHAAQNSHESSNSTLRTDSDAYLSAASARPVKSSLRLFRRKESNWT